MFRAANRSSNGLRGVIVGLTLATGIAPAAADMRYDRAYAGERIEYRTEHREFRRPRGCGVRARADGWCYGERVGPHVRREALGELRAREDRYLPRGTRIEPPRRERVRRKRDDGLAIALGIAGLAAGALIAGTIANDNAPASYDPRFDRPRDPQPKPLPRLNRDAFPPAPAPGAYGAPTNAPAGNPYEPWSAAWLDACRARYRSFNARTGTFRTYGGEDKFCTGPR